MHRFDWTFFNGNVLLRRLCRFEWGRPSANVSNSSFYVSWHIPINSAYKTVSIQPKILYLCVYMISITLLLFSWIHLYFKKRWSLQNDCRENFKERVPITFGSENERGIAGMESGLLFPELIKNYLLNYILIEKKIVFSPYVWCSLYTTIKAEKPLVGAPLEWMALDLSMLLKSLPWPIPSPGIEAVIIYFFKY